MRFDPAPIGGAGIANQICLFKILVLPRASEGITVRWSTEDHCNPWWRNMDAYSPGWQIYNKVIFLYVFYIGFFSASDRPLNIISTLHMFTCQNFYVTQYVRYRSSTLHNSTLQNSTLQNLTLRNFTLWIFTLQDFTLQKYTLRNFYVTELYVTEFHVT